MNKMQSCDLIRTPLVDLPNALVGQQVSVDWDRRYWSAKRSDIAQELADFRTGIDAYFSITFDLQRSVMLVALDSVLCALLRISNADLDLDSANNRRGTQTNRDATQEDVLDGGACVISNKSVR
jgi:hypothetical protein